MLFVILSQIQSSTNLFLTSLTYYRYSYATIDNNRLKQKNLLVRYDLRTAPLMQNSTTIFKQLILNIILPVVAAIFVLGALNYYHTQSILVEANETKNELISNEIKNILQFQDYSFDLIENELNIEIESFSKILAEYVFKNTDSIEIADLHTIREQIGMDSRLQDIYIINTDGIVVNTTYKKDLGLNLFNFGKAHKEHLLDILKKEKICK